MQRTVSISSPSGRNRVRLGIAALVLLMIAGLSYLEWRQYNRANAEAAQSRECVDVAERLLLSLTDAEAGQRGFLLTGQDRYLEPYSQAIQVIPTALTQLSGMLESRQDESSNLAQLRNLVDQRIAQLRQGIDLRRTQGPQPALAFEITGQGKRTTDEIRGLAEEVRRRENSVGAEALAAREVAARTALLATVAGVWLLLFFVVAGVEPLMSSPLAAKERSWLARYGVAVLATIVAFGMRVALVPLLGRTGLPFSIPLCAVLFAAWFGGFRSGLLSVVLSALASLYFFTEPFGSFMATDQSAQIELLIFIVVGSGMALMGNSQRRALARARRAEEAERAGRQRFETTLASIGDAVIATDATGRITFANKVALSLLRWPEAEVSGKQLDEVFRVINEFTRATVEGPVARVLREGAIVGLTNHTVLLARDGTEVPIDDSAAPIQDGSGVVQGTVLVFRDTTARRRADQGNRLLASIVESSEDAIISKDLNGIVTTWNKGAERMLGYTAEEMYGHSISVIAHPEKPDEMPGILERIKRGERMDPFQTVRRTKSGKLIHVSGTISPVHDAVGRITGASKIVRDITPQVLANEELAEGRERLRITLSSIGDAVLTTDAAGHVSYLNPVAEQLTGWASAEAEGKPLEEIFRIVNEHSRMTVESPVVRVLREGSIVGLANHTVLLARDGREVFIDDSAAPIRDQHGAILGTVLAFRDIGERRRMERELEKGAQNLRVALEAGRMGAWDWSVASGKVNWSGSLEAIHGLAPGGFGGSFESYLSDVHPDDLEYVRQSIPRALEEKADHNIEYRIIWPDGSIHWIQGTGRVVLDENGNATGMTGICTDITERKRLEQELQKAAAIVEASDDAIVGEDLDGAILTWNPGAEKVYGYAADEVIGRRSTLLAPPGREHEIPEMMERIRTGERIRQLPAKRRRKDGAVIDVSLTVSPVKSDTGRIIAAAVLARDVTERRQAEERFHLAVEAAPTGMLLTNAAGEILLVNSEMERLFGYSREELIGQPVEILVPQDLGDRHARHRRDFYAAPHARRMGEGRDLHGRRKDGSTFPIEVGLNPIETSQGGWVLSSVMDVTQRKRIEEQRVELLAKERALASEQALRETEAELARVARALTVGELAASIAHEINQPIAGVVTNAEAGLRWLGGATPDIQEAKQSLGLIARDGNRAADVIRRIRGLLQKGRHETAQLDINETIHEAVAIARSEMLKRRIELRLELSPDLPLVRGDRIQLQQVILNLIMNALDAMASAGGQERELVVSSQKTAGASVRVAVRDSGAGISSQVIARMFDAFFTTKPMGMGMGLSLSRSIVEAHGGEISAALNEGAGMTVEFSLPGEGAGRLASAASNPS